MPLTSPPQTGPPLQQVDRTYVLHRRRRFIYFGGCDYFRLSSHPAVTAAVRAAVGQYGLNVSASRITTGNHQLYIEAEKRLARFFGVEQAVLVSSGYVSNLIAAQSCKERFDHVLIDEKAHASLLDAAVFLGRPVRPFRHCDASSLQTQLAALKKGARPIVLTDGLFAQDGSVAPLADYLALLPRRGGLLVDDAHGVGVLGEKGRGARAGLAVRDHRVIETATLSKAFGVYGGVVLGRASEMRAVGGTRLFAGSTPVPLPVVAGILMAVALLQKDGGFQARLARNTAYVKKALNEAGLATVGNASPIVSLVPESPSAIAWLKRRLSAAGIYPTFVKYPGGPPMGHFRFALSSEHTREQLDRLIEVLAGMAVSSGPRRKLG